MEPAKKSGEAAGLRKVQGDSNMCDDILECPVCMTAFDDTVRRPRTLLCGHMFCTLCIDGLENHGQVTCPTCRVVHTVPEVGQFPICYAYEDLIKKMSDVGFASPSLMTKNFMGDPALSPAIGPSQKRPVGLSRAICSMLQEQEAKVLAAIRAFQEVQGQLDHYQTTLAVWGGQQQRLDNKLQALMDRNKSARVLVRQEESQVADKRQQMKQEEQQLHTMLQALRTVYTLHEACEVINDADHRADEGRQRMEECHRMLPDVNTVTTITKAMVVSRAAVKAAETVEYGSVGTAEDRSLPEDSTFTITERLHCLLAPTLEAEDLRTLTQPTRSLLQAGLVFATHKVEGRSRHARIHLEDGRLYLHSLQDQTIPTGAATLQMDDMVPTAPPCLVFLDLEWPGSATRRVLIRLTPDTPMGRQFVFLCTGQRGPSYVNTRLFKVWHKGHPGECVDGGDYENNNGTGGAALLSDIDKGEYWKSGQAGTVYRVCRGGNTSDCNARFGIRIRDCQDGVVSVSVFGEVIDGLEGVAAAALQSPINEVTVVNCGVVLWA